MKILASHAVWSSTEFSVPCNDITVTSRRPPKMQIPEALSSLEVVPQIAQAYIHCQGSCCEKAYLLVGKNRSLNFYFRLTPKYKQPRI